MRLFNELIFDNDIRGTTLTWYSLPDYGPVLGAADMLVFQAQVGNVTGTSPTLTIRVQFSGDNLHWVNAQASAEINAVSLAANANHVIQKNGTSGGVHMGYVRVAISMGGSNPFTRLKVFACGRSL